MLARVHETDVLVIGGGNAGLCAAIEARKAGAEVVLVERAPVEWRGGNSKYTRNIRCVQADGTYSQEDLAQDLAAVTGPRSNMKLTSLVIQLSRFAPPWMESNGIRWQPPLNGTLSLSQTNRFFLGGGKALVNTYFETADALGVRTKYRWRVDGLKLEQGRCTEVSVASPEGARRIRPRAVVAASGGFEANLAWLADEVGPGVRNAAVRGTRGNDGSVLKLLLDAGAQRQGDPAGFHAIAVDARGPQYEGGIITRVDSVPLGIMVNTEAERFGDEGEDLWPKRYATWGKRILEQRDQLAFSIFDQKIVGRFMSTAFPPHRASSVAGLARELDLDPDRLQRTVEEYNDSVRSGSFDPQSLDDCRTEGLDPPKSHWAQTIDEGPFFAYPLRPGITFTYCGVGVDEHARVVRSTGEPFENVFAAGEIMAGNVLRRGYLAGFGMTIGTVFGRLAGEGASSVARA